MSTYVISLGDNVRIFYILGNKMVCIYLHSKDISVEICSRFSISNLEYEMESSFGSHIFSHSSKFFTIRSFRRDVWSLGLSLRRPQQKTKPEEGATSLSWLRQESMMENMREKILINTPLENMVIRGRTIIRESSFILKIAVCIQGAFWQKKGGTNKQYEYTLK